MVTMDPSVWRNFNSRYLTQEMLSRVPGLELMHLRRVCKDWNSMIIEIAESNRLSLGTKCVTFHSPERKVAHLTTWDPKGNIAITQEVSFPSCNIKKLSLLDSGGGLLCFGTGFFGQFIIYNPLKKVFKEITWTPLGDKAHQRAELVVKVMISPENSHNYNVIILEKYPIHKNLGAQIFDSARNSWRKVQPSLPFLTRDFGTDRPLCQNFISHVAICNGHLFCLYKALFHYIRVLKYDIMQNECTEIPIPGLRIHGLSWNTEGQLGVFELFTRRNRIMLLTSGWSRRPSDLHTLFLWTLNESQSGSSWSPQNKILYTRRVESHDEEERGAHAAISIPSTHHLMIPRNESHCFCNVLDDLDAAIATPMPSCLQHLSHHSWYSCLRIDTCEYTPSFTIGRTSDNVERLHVSADILQKSDSRYYVVRSIVS